MIDTQEIFSRQSSMFDQLTLMTRRCVMLWCWFVWSNLAYNLMKTWFRQFLLVDFDTVEEGNLLNQMYTSDVLWMKKTTALQNRLIWDFPLDYIWIEEEERIENVLNKNQLIDWDLVFVSADNLEIRLWVIEYFIKELEKWNHQNTILCIMWTWSDLIRISFEKNRIEKLKFIYNFLSDDSIEEDQWICWYKSAYFLWSLISWLVIWELRNKYLNNSKDEESWFVVETNPLVVHLEQDCSFWEEIKR